MIYNDESKFVKRRREQLEKDPNYNPNYFENVFEFGWSKERGFYDDNKRSQ